MVSLIVNARSLHLQKPVCGYPEHIRRIERYTFRGRSADTHYIRVLVDDDNGHYLDIDITDFPGIWVLRFIMSGQKMSVTYPKGYNPGSLERIEVHYPADDDGGDPMVYVYVNDYPQIIAKDFKRKDVAK